MLHSAIACLYLSLSAAAITALTGCAGEADDPGGGFDESLAESSLTFTGFWVYDAGTQCTVGGATMHCCPTGYAMIGAHVDHNVFKCAQVSYGLGGRFLDVATQRNGMHACPYGALMTGLHVAWNYLTCQYPYEGVASEYVDGGTQDGYPMHVCGPGGYAMSGIHVAQNRFTCAR